MERCEGGERKWCEGGEGERRKGGQACWKTGRKAGWEREACRCRQRKGHASFFLVLEEGEGDSYACHGGEEGEGWEELHVDGLRADESSCLLGMFA